MNEALFSESEPPVSADTQAADPSPSAAASISKTAASGYRKQEPVQILSSGSILRTIPDTDYFLQLPITGRQKLRFSRAYRMEESILDIGVRQCRYRIHNRFFHDLSCMEGEVLRCFSDGAELRRHRDGTAFLYSRKAIPTGDLWDRVWNTQEQTALFRDQTGIHLIAGRNGYRLSAIEIYLDLKNDDGFFSKLLTE